MGNIFEIVVKVFIEIVKGLLYAVSFILQEVFIPLLKGLWGIVTKSIKRGKEKWTESNLNEVIQRVEQSNEINEGLRASAKSLYDVISADGNGDDVERVGGMVDYCEKVAKELCRYKDKIDEDLRHTSSVDNKYLLSKYQGVQRYIDRLKYPMTDGEMRQVLAEHQSSSRFIETLLSFAAVDKINHVENNVWNYQTSRATYTLEIDEDTEMVHISALPNKTIVQKGDCLSQTLKNMRVSVNFNSQNQLEINYNCSIREIDHYDVSEFFDFMQRLIHKKEIITFGETSPLGEVVINSRESRRLKEFFDEKMQFIKQTAPPPVDNVPDNQKMHGGKQRWAQLEDVRNAGLLNTEGFIIGKLGYGAYIYTGNYSSHILTIASVGSGKGIGVVIPNLLRHKGSVVVLDPKGENFFVTARKRKKLGNDVFYFDPWNVVGGYGFNAERIKNYATRATINPLDFIKADSSDMVDNARMLAASLILRTDSNGDFFYNEAETFITRLIVFVCTTYSVGNRNRNLLTVRDLLTLPSKMLISKLLKVRASNKEFGKETHPLVLDLISWLDKNITERPRSFTDIYSFALQATEFLSNPSLADSFDRSNIDILKIKTNLTSLYLILDMDKLLFAGEQYKPLVRLVITTCMMGASAKEIPNEKMLFMLDEIAQLGNLQYLPNLLSIYRSKGVVVWTIWQNIAQIQKNYEKEWQTIMGNCDVQQYFGVNDYETAKRVSEGAGQTTIFKESYTAGETNTESETYSESYNSSYSRGTSQQQSSNSGYSYQGFNYGSTRGTGSASGVTDNYTDSYNFSSSIQLGVSMSRSRTLAKETVPLITPYEVKAGSGCGVQFVFYTKKCQYPILSGKIRYYEELEFYNEYDKNITIYK